MRLIRRAGSALPTAHLAALLLVPGAGADERLSTLECAGDPAALRAPALLIHGTGVTAEENWSWGYAKALRDRGHAVCTIDLPKRATVDLQDSLPITAAAIREISRRGGGRRIAIVGHSQGASQAVLALRFWPRLAGMVDDVVGLAGAYDRGSEAIGARCPEGECPPPFWQFAPGSRFLASLATRAPPAGPSITAIGTLHDTVVTPQPEANAVPGGRSMQIQDVCPGRRFAGELDHIHMAADAVAFALAVDALDHPGTADPARIPPSTCALDVYPEADAVKLATLAPKLMASFQGEGAAPPAAREPRLRCPFAAGCDVLTRVRPVRRRVAAGGVLALRVRVARSGHIRLRAGGRPTRARRVEPGARTVRIRLPRRLAPGPRRATVQAQSVPGSGWATVRRLRVRVLAVASGDGPTGPRVVGR